ncbi:MAG: hypothetical protein KIS94_10625 [Chitinophagales bacterium]|nr:hypothetical protein [Chitinophagales bacterium]
MKKVFLPLLAVAFIVSASSCAKCVTCKKGDQWQKLCDKDNDKDDVNDAIDALETLGWDCKASSQMY